MGLQEDLSEVDMSGIPDDPSLDIPSFVIRVTAFREYIVQAHSAEEAMTRIDFDEDEPTTSDLEVKVEQLGDESEEGERQTDGDASES